MGVRRIRVDAKPLHPVFEAFAAALERRLPKAIQERTDFRLRWRRVRLVLAAAWSERTVAVGGLTHRGHGSTRVGRCEINQRRRIAAGFFGEAGHLAHREDETRPARGL